MKGVIDTNQSSSLPLQYKFTGPNQPKKKITLPPFVFGEILLRANPDPTLKLLRQFEVQFGLDIGETIRSFSALPEDRMNRFTPFVNPLFARHYARLYSALDFVTDEHRNWARKTKADHLAFCGQMAREGLAFRRRAVGQGAQPAKFNDLNDAINRTPFFRNVVVQSMTNAGQRPTNVANPDRLYATVMANPFLGRMWKSILFWHVSWSRNWNDQAKNFDASGKRDDWVDMTLPLYAADGDIILTADAKVKMAVAASEPQDAVTTGLAKDF